MKKLIYFILAFVLLYACDRATETDELAPDVNLSNKLPKEIYAAMADAEDEEDSLSSRTYVDGTKVRWQGGDAISYFTGKYHNAQYVYDGEDGPTSAKLSWRLNGEESTTQLNGTYAVYPYDENTECVVEDGVEKIRVKYPREQFYASNSFGNGANLMVATGNDGALSFRNACGYLVLKMYGTNTYVGRVILISYLSNGISGDASIVLDENGIPQVTMHPRQEGNGKYDDLQIVLNCVNDSRGVKLSEDPDHPTEFWFALPPVPIPLFTVQVTTLHKSSNVENYYDLKIENNKHYNIVRNQVLSMKAFEFTKPREDMHMVQYTYTKDRKDIDRDDWIFDEYGKTPTNRFDKIWQEQEIIDGKYTVTFNECPTKVMDQGFKDCTDLKSIILPEGLTTIGKEAFAGCTGLEEVILPQSLVTIGDDAFNGCTNLRNIVIPANVTTIGARTFFGCNNLQNVTNSSNCLTTIGKEAFRDTKITGITLPETLTTIGEGAFRNAPITSITIPGAVNTIGVDAFYDCTKLASVKFNPSPSETPLKIGYTIKNSDADGPFYYSPLTSIDLDRTLVLTDGNGNTFTTSAWGEGLFANKYWEDQNYLNQGTSVKLGEQVKTIQKRMFNWVPVREIIIPDQITTVGEKAFEGCSKLARVTIEPSTTQLVFNSDAPFFDSPLEYINFNRPLQPYGQSKGLFEVNEEFMDKNFTTEVHFGTNMKKIEPRMFANLPMSAFTIHSSITQVGNNAFFGCEKLASVTFEGSSSPLTMGYMVHGDGDQTGPFYDSPLAEINLNRELIYQLPYADIDEWAEGVFPNKYWDKVNKVNVTIGENVKNLSKFMFSWLAIKELTLPGTLESVGEYAFKGCEDLETLKIAYSSTPLIIKGQGNDGDGDDFDYGPFYDSPLKKIEFDRAFNYQKFDGTAYTANHAEKGIFTIDPDYLDETNFKTTVKIGTHVSVIPEYMFSNLPIQTLEIPANVTEIKNFAFDECKNLSVVYFLESTQPLTIGFQPHTDQRGPFYDSPLRGISIKRELVCSESYSSALDEWDEGIFANQYNKESGDKLATVQLLLGDNFKTISKYMFANLGLEGFRLPANVTKIEDFAFLGCTNLKWIDFDFSDQPLEIGFQPGTDQVGPFYQSPLENLYISRQLNPSASYAAALNNNDEGIFSSTYYNDKSYPTTKIHKLENVTTIPKYMFACSRISEITIPASVTHIGNDAFRDCDLLHTVIIESSSNSLTISSQSGDWSTFYDSPLSTIKLDREINYVTPNGSAFTPDKWNEGLFANEEYDGNFTATVEIGSNVKTISNWMFSCVRMQSVEIPASVTSIGKEAFYWCPLLSQVTCQGTEAPTLGENAFKDCNQMKAGSITVPSGSLSSYQSKWSSYSGWLSERE